VWNSNILAGVGGDVLALSCHPNVVAEGEVRQAITPQPVFLS